MTRERIVPAGEEATDDSIRFRCPACREVLLAELDRMGSEMECPDCGRLVRVPQHLFSVNPFHRPIRRLLGNLRRIQWSFPFLPQLIETLVILLVVLVSVGLYATFGIASQVVGILQSLMADARREIRLGGLVEKSAYALAVAIYSLLWLPFWLALLPFTLLGLAWKHLGYPGLVIFLLLLAALAWLAWSGWPPSFPARPAGTTSVLPGRSLPAS